MVYDVNINIMTDGRIQFFKSVKHFKEKGMNLRIYDTKEDMFNDFSFSDFDREKISNGIDKLIEKLNKHENIKRH